MKKIKLLSAMVLFAGLTIMAGNALAQRGQGRGTGMMNNTDRTPRMAMGQCIMDLTPEQQEEINTLRANHLKEVTPLRNELNEKRARLQTLKSADTYDLDAINKTIDEMSAVRAKIQKKGAAQRAEVSKLLTDEQRAVFNSRRAGKRSGRGSRGQGMMGRGARGYSKW